MYDLPLIIGHLPLKFQNKIKNFITLCDDLQNLLDTENNILLDKGTIPFESFCAEKLLLLGQFENDIKSVFDTIKIEAPDNKCLQMRLIEIIQNVRRSLCVNTTFQLSDLKKRTARIEKLKDGLVGFAQLSDEDSRVCH